MKTSFALEHLVHFFSEQRTESYKSTVTGVAQLKNVLSAENTLTGQTCSVPGRCGA